MNWSSNERMEIGCRISNYKLIRSVIITEKPLRKLSSQVNKYIMIEIYLRGEYFSVIESKGTTIKAYFIYLEGRLRN